MVLPQFSEAYAAADLGTKVLTPWTQRCPGQGCHFWVQHFNVKISAPYMNDLDFVSVNQYSSNRFIYFNGTLPIKQPRGLLIQG